VWAANKLATTPKGRGRGPPPPLTPDLPVARSNQVYGHLTPCERHASCSTAPKTCDLLPARYMVPGPIVLQLCSRQRRAQESVTTIGRERAGGEAHQRVDWGVGGSEHRRRRVELAAARLFGAPSWPVPARAQWRMAPSSS
jgi:hypothetical protein